MYAFDTDISISESALIEHQIFIPKSGPLDVNEGVVVPVAGNIREPEVWVCSRTGHRLTILHPKKFSIIDEVHTGELEDKARVVRHMHTMLANGQSFLVIANRHLIERWDVELRQKKDEFDMIVHYKEFYGDDSKFCTSCV